MSHGLVKRKSVCRPEAWTRALLLRNRLPYVIVIEGSKKEPVRKPLKPTREDIHVN